MPERQEQEVHRALMSEHEFLEACSNGSLSRIDATQVAAVLRASIQSSGLQRAVKNTHFNVVRYLLELEPAIEISTETANHAAWDGLPLYRLLHSNMPSMIDWSFDPENRAGNAVHTAVRSHNTELLIYLLDNGADPGRSPECTRFGDTFAPIDHAALVNNEEAARIFVRYGATFRATEATAIAAQFGFLGLIRCFIELGADINYICGIQDPHWADYFGSRTSALHSAVEGGHLEMVKELIAYGADPYLQDMDGVTARDLDLNTGHGEILETLESASAGCK